MAAPGPSLPLARLGSFDRLPDIIAVTSAFEAVPDAKHVYACDRKWWKEFHAPVCARHPRAALWAHDDGRAHYPGVRTVAFDDLARDGSKRPPAPDFCDIPGRLHHGGNSGYQAMNLAKQLGYELLLLVGFDMKRTGGRAHFFGEYRSSRLARQSPYAEWAPRFRTITTSPSFRIVNCTPGSAIDAFPFGSLEEFCS